MDLYINNQTLIIIVLAIVLMVILFFIFKKIIRKILILLVLVGLGYYILVFSNIFKNPNEHSKYSIDYLKDKYSTEMIDHSDSVKYFMVVLPIYDDMKSTYTNQELLDLEKNPVKYFQALNQSIKRNKSEILKNLAKNKQEEIWDNFINDLKHKYPQQEIAK